MDLSCSIIEKERKIKGIFCHDLPIYKDINGIYCSTTLTDAVFSRYLNVVDELLIATRIYPINQSYVDAGQERITLKNLSFIELPNVNVPTAIFKTIPDVRRILEKEIKDVDLIFIRGGTIALLGIDASKKLGKPYLLESGGCAWDAYWNHSLLGKIIAPYMEFRNKKAAKDASFVVYVTQKWLQDRYPSKGIGVAVSDVLIKDIGNNIILQRKDKILRKQKNEPIILGTTAAIDVSYKGQQYVIKAMSQLKDALDLRYQLVGGGNSEFLYKIAKRYKVADRIIFKGELPHDEVLKWLDNIDIYIQPSLLEGLPRALIEAMSRGCPSIGSNIGGIPELLDKKFIFYKKDVNDLSTRIKSMVKADLTDIANSNFEKAKLFYKPYLDKKREAVFENYRNYVIGSSK